MTRRAEVSEAIEHFDELDARATARGEPFPSCLTQTEDAWITGEILKCRASFTYAARNYFYIIEKNSTESLFDLWEAQELLWETIQWLWRLGRPAWIIVCKARQLGFSTLVQALIAWTCIFFKFKTCLIVADDPGQSEWLFSKMLHIYDRLPFWLQPMVASRRMKEGLVFDNPNYDLRRLYPGNASTIIVESANKLTSIGQGKTLSGAHVSELSSYRPDGVARDIIEEDLSNACVDSPGNFQIIESTPRGTSNYFYELWTKNWAKGVNARYFPFYAPAFMERARRRTPPRGFTLTTEEARLRENYAAHWNSCASCHILVPTDWLSDSRTCFRCGSGDLLPVILDDSQIYWYREKLEYHREMDRGKRNANSVKKFYQEMSVAPLQGFQITGLQAFTDAAMQRVMTDVSAPSYVGSFDESKKFHYNDRRDPSGIGECSICGHDHSLDATQVWELPRPGEKYVLGVDTSEGLANGDFSVGVVFRLGRMFEPDEEVCVWRARADTDEIARNCFLIGSAYNNALVAIEVGTGDGTLSQYKLTSAFGYSNIYWWKHFDSDLMHMRTKKMGWVTNRNSRRMLFAHFNSWLTHGYCTVRSQNFLEEARTCVKDDDEAQARAERGKFDDEVMATMIASLAGNDDQYDNQFRAVGIRSMRRSAPPSGAWECFCEHCNAPFNADDPRDARCPSCLKLAARASRRAPTGVQCPSCHSIFAQVSYELCPRCRSPLANAPRVPARSSAVIGTGGARSVISVSQDFEDS